MTEVRCECGWRKEYLNPVAALFGLEKHWEFCSLKGGDPNVINREKYAGDPILRAADFKDGQTVTIDWFKEIKSQLRDKPIQPAIALQGQGFENRFLPLNTTNLDKLIEKFGLDEEKWKGKKVQIRIIDTETPDGDPAKGIRIA
ncbi:MAG: hypothetical protein ACREUI_02135 [Burkholderiales bacterium]